MRIKDSVQRIVIRGVCEESGALRRSLGLCHETEFQALVVHVHAAACGRSPGIGSMCLARSLCVFLKCSPTEWIAFAHLLQDVSIRESIVCRNILIFSLPFGLAALPRQTVCWAEGFFGACRGYMRCGRDHRRRTRSFSWDHMDEVVRFHCNSKRISSVKGVFEPRKNLPIFVH